jgi:type II secretory pathway pseudopilin PulG
MKRKNKNYSGMTIVELLVAISILTIGMAGFSLLFLRVWQGNRFSFEMGQSAMAVSQGVNQIVEYIRGARQSDGGTYPVFLADDNDFIFYADYDKDSVVEKLRIHKEGTDVWLSVANPLDTVPKSYPVNYDSDTKIAQRIVNDAGSPIFFYYDKTYNGGSGQVPMDTPASVSDVRLVKIHLYINIDPNRAPDNIEMQSFVELRNLNDYNNVE